MSEFEKEFYKTFDIPAREQGYCNSFTWRGKCDTGKKKRFEDCETCRNCKDGNFYIMPEFTPYRLLEMICLMANIYGLFPSIRRSETTRFEDLKHEILKAVVNAYGILSKEWKPEFYNGIRQIMEVKND